MAGDVMGMIPLSCGCTVSEETYQTLLLCGKHGLSPVRVDTYICGHCQQEYVEPGRVRFRCAVNHPPGDCCHYGESLIRREQGDSWSVPVGPGGPMDVHKTVWEER